MTITRLTIQIGDKKVEINNCDGNNSDFALLMRLASSSSLIHLEVPATPEAAEALGRLSWVKNDAQATEEAMPASGYSKEQEDFLATRLQDAYFSMRSWKALAAINVQYIWELVEKREDELFDRVLKKGKIGNFGRKSFNEVKELLGEKNLTLGTTLLLAFREKLAANSPHHP